MLVLLTSKDTKINYIFQEGEVDSIYLKIEYNTFPDGKTMEVLIKTYLTKEDYLVDNYVYTDIPDNGFHVQIDTFNETQSLEYATLYAIKRFESLGYKCDILND